MGEVQSKAGSTYFDGVVGADAFSFLSAPSSKDSETSGSDISTTSSQSSLRLEDGALCENVIVFDWDDTLLCSTAINTQQWSQVQLELLEPAVEAILTTAMSLGETLIVTNGISSWVQDSARRFLPGLVPLIDRLQVHSARAKYEQSYPGDPMSWKRQAFKDIFASRRKAGSPNRRGWDGSPGSVSSAGQTDGVNMVVIGDSCAEIEAARATGRMLGKPTLVKTVKFKEGPSVHELVGQLRKVDQELGQVVLQEESMHRSLYLRPPLPPSLDYLSSWASGWKISEEKHVSFFGF